MVQTFQLATRQVADMGLPGQSNNGMRGALKYVAKVARVLQHGIHIRALPGGPMTEMPLAARVEIELDGAECDPCMIYRYADDKAFAGDTWHESLADAGAQIERPVWVDFPR
jgi:hypothetical protein